MRRLPPWAEREVFFSVRRWLDGQPLPDVSDEEDEREYRWRMAKAEHDAWRAKCRAMQEEYDRVMDEKPARYDLLRDMLRRIAGIWPGTPTRTWKPDDFTGNGGLPGLRQCEGAFWENTLRALEETIEMMP